MAFVYKGTVFPDAGRLIIGGPDVNNTNGSFFTGTLIANSAVVKVGDVIATVTSGSNIVVRRYNAAADAIVGVLVSVAKVDGTTATPDSGTTDTWTVTATNETGAALYAVVDASPWSVWSANQSGTINTTQNAGLGTAFDPDTGANAGRILESSASRTAGAGRGYACIGQDPADTTRVLVVCAEHVFGGQTISAA